MKEDVGKIVVAQEKDFAERRVKARESSRLRLYNTGGARIVSTP